MTTWCLWKTKVSYDIFNQLGWSYRNIMQFQISSRGENSSRNTWVNNIRVPRKVFNNFALSEAEDNIPGPLNRGGIADLPLLRTLLAIRQKSRESGFWEVIGYFLLLAYASLAASRTSLQWLLACLNFTLDSEELFSWYKRKKWLLMSYGSFTSSWKWWRWVRLNLIFTMSDRYINSNLNQVAKFTSSSRSTEFKDIFL